MPATHVHGPALLVAILLAAMPMTTTAAEEAASETGFPKIYDSEARDIDLSSHEQALASIEMPRGFQATLFAAEPQVQQPIGMTFDERGRLWVAENYTYAENTINFDRSLNDRIVIFEDADADGRADRRTVFWDQAKQLTSVEVGMGGVWAMCPPELLFIPDADRDDKPDGPPVVVLDGFDHATIRHTLANGLKWGPDGWLYGRHGIQQTSLVGKPGATASQRTALNCCVWRYHPTRGAFEVVASGTTNPWGFDYDQHGEMFMINTVIGHLWHVVPGAHFRRMYGADLQPRLYQLLEQTADHFHWDTGERWSDIRQGVSDTTSAAGGGHAHIGLMIYQGDNWPAEYRGGVFTLNLHGRRINHDRLERQGSAFVARHAQDMVFWGDPWFRGIELAAGPDGGVFVLDWSDVGECHENDGVHRTSGRIYKITHGTPPALAAFDLADNSDQQLVDLQLHANDWQVRQARRLLQERAAADKDMTSARTALVRMFDEHEDVTRKLRALWCLHSMGALDETDRVALLDHADEHVRVWGVRLVVDGGAPSSAAIAALAKLAERESSSLVRLYLASALQKLPLAARWQVAEPIARASDLADDTYAPLMLWYGLEPAVAAEPERGIALAAATHIPLLRRHIARRLTEELDHAPEPVERLVALAIETHDAAARRDIVLGMSEATSGWLRAKAPANWPELVSAASRPRDDATLALVRQMSIVFGDGRAIDSLLPIARSEDADPDARRQALAAITRARSDEVLELLKELVSRDRVLKVEAIRAIAAYDDITIARLLINTYRRLGPEGQVEAINALASRPASAAALLEAVGDGRVPRDDVTAFHARQIQSFGDAELVRVLAAVWGEVRATADDKLKLLSRYRELLTTEQLAEADASRGRVLFTKTCSNCHVLFGQGKTVGPDLTGSNRRNLDYLLENLVDPSAAVAANFRMSVVALTDGRVLTGVIFDQNERTLVLQMQQEAVTLDRSLIDEVQPTSLSLMPEGVLGTLSDEEVLDLTAYLMSPSQVATPEESAAR